MVRVAQWVDLGYRDVDFLQELLAEVSARRSRKHDSQAYLQLRMAEAFCAMGEEDLDGAIELLEFVLKAEDELGDQRLAAIAHFWKGRSHRKKGEYDAAMAHVVRGRSLMQTIPAPKLAAVIQIQESWLLFQTGKTDEALGCSMKPEQNWRTPTMPCRWAILSRPKAAWSVKPANTPRRCNISPTRWSCMRDAIQTIATWRGRWSTRPRSSG